MLTDLTKLMKYESNGEDSKAIWIQLSRNAAVLLVHRVTRYTSVPSINTVKRFSTANNNDKWLILYIPSCIVS